MNLDQIRRNYLRGGLRRDDLADDPFEQFKAWMEDALAADIPDPTAMTLATVNAEGQPSQRIVLLKQLDPRGFVFFTNYGSNKAADIAANPRVSLHFPWHWLERQVKVSGVAEKIPASESLKYFLSRPRDSQLAAWASHQSHPLTSRSALLNQFARMKEKFAQGEIPLPDHWGGFRVTPSRFEFWQGGEDRLHDRFKYLREQDGDWRITRLAP